MTSPISAVAILLNSPWYDWTLPTLECYMTRPDTHNHDFGFRDRTEIRPFISIRRADSISLIPPLAGNSSNKPTTVYFHKYPLSMHEKVAVTRDIQQPCSHRLCLLPKVIRGGKHRNSNISPRHSRCVILMLSGCFQIDRVLRRIHCTV